MTDPPPVTLSYESALQRPTQSGVWRWYIVYCVAMVLYVACCCITAGLHLLRLADTMEDDSLATIMLAVCGPLVAVFGVAPWLPKRPWTWVVHLLLICLGLTSPLLWPTNIPLLVFWTRRHNRRYFDFC